MYRYLILVFLCVLCHFVLPVAASAQTEEEQQQQKQLQMFFREEELLVVSSTRSLKPISRVAENMTVITAEDIERMNAHTLDEVLNTVNGVQVLFSPKSPGNSWASVMIQGSDQKHVAVIVDGVPLNQLSNNKALIGDFPVQHIERIEIIKGPASSVWGSALGGVINIITKEPPDKGVSGSVSSSYGSNHTEDYRAEVRGKSGPFGIYLYAGGMHTNGLIPWSAAYNNHLYSKVTYAVLPSTDIRFSLYYQKSRIFAGDLSEFDVADKDRQEQYYGSLSLTSRLSNNITLDFSAWAKRRQNTLTEDILSTGENYYSNVYDDRKYGANARVTWKTAEQTIVGGTEFTRDILKSNVMESGKEQNDKWAVFINDSITWGNLTVTPGLRVEGTTIGGNSLSPSFGATYALTSRSIIRANVARGFYTPSFVDKYGSMFQGTVSMQPNPDIRVEKVWSYQAGFETAELRYFWIKASVFRHDISDIINDSGSLSLNEGKQRRQGFEVEAKTLTLYNMFLSGGTSYIFSKDRISGETKRNIPQYTYDAALTYDDKKSFKAVLKGRYIWWNSDNTSAKYSSFIVDLTLTKSLIKMKGHTLETFASAHNMFNGRQDTANYYRTPKKWVEIGLRYKF